MALGLLGSLHCAGMCGGFALIVGSLHKQDSRLAALAYEWAYIGGKALTYGILGLLCHLSVAALTGGHDESVTLAGSPIHTSGARLVAAWLAGGTLILIGLKHLGLHLPKFAGAYRLRPLWQRSIGEAWKAVRSLPGITGSFAIGVLTGLLPCGLSWSAILLGAPNDPLLAFLGPFAFGFSTAPALILSARAGKFVGLRAGNWPRKLIGPALVLLGILTLARGGLPGAAPLTPECCAHPEGP